MTDGPTTKHESRGVRDVIVVGLIVLATSVSFLPALRNGFVYDDRVTVVENLDFRGLSPSHLRWMATTFFPGHYHPLTWLTLGFDHLLWGMDPFGYHLTNLVLHAANAVLAYFLIRAFLGTRGEVRGHGATPGQSAGGRNVGPLASRACCAAGALFFAVHPLRVESVAWVTERRDVLSGLFYLLTVLAYLRMQERAGADRLKWRVICLLCFALSLLSKAWGITLPVVLLILDAYPLRRLAPPGRARADGAPGAAAPPGQGRASWRELLTEKLPFFAAALAFGVLAFLAQKAHAMDMVKDHGVADRLMQAAYGLCFYPAKTVAPLGLSPLYLLKPSFDPWAAKYVLCACLAAGVTIGLVCARRRWPWALTAWAGYAATVFPVLGLAQSGEQLVADRYAYLSCLPFAVLAGAGLLRLWGTTQGTRAPRAALTAGATAALVALSVATFRQTQVWRDGVTLWNHALRLDPGNYVAHYSRGAAQQKLGDHDAALADYNTALRLNPDHVHAHNNRGNIRLRRGDVEGALEDYETAIRLSPSTAPPYINRGNLREKQGDFKGALEDYGTALRLAPDAGDAWYNRGVLRQKCGDAEGALEDYAAAIRLNPSDAPAYSNRGSLRQARGDLDGALADYNAAIRANPKYAPAHFNRANARETRGDADAALQDYTRTIELDPRHARAYSNRGALRKQRGDAPGALEDYNQALQLDPKLAVAYANRGVLHNERADFAAAVRDFAAALQVAPPDWPSRANVVDLLDEAQRMAALQGRR